MSTTALDIKQYTNIEQPLTMLQLRFIAYYITNGGNGTQAAKDAGFRCKSDVAFSRRASDLLRQSRVNQEISYRLQQIEDTKVAKAAEIKQFYTSVMRGEVLDQFGIECSVDTRIKAANELAKWEIEMPMKLQQKETSNNLGSITLNFLPRKEED